METKNHNIAKGDTLGKIAQQYNTTVTELQRLNNLGNSTTIIAGRTLKVPAGKSDINDDKPSTPSRPDNVPKLNITENLLTLGKRNRQGVKMIKIKAVALHWIAGPNGTNEAVRNWFESEQAVGSTQYCIDTAGNILRMIPEDEVGWHVGSSQNDPKSGRPYTDRARTLLGTEAFTGKSKEGFWITPNYFCLGIEMSHTDWNGTFTEATLQSAAQLVADILIRHNLTIDAVTTHYEIVGWKDCPKLWFNQPALFEQFKERVEKILTVVNGHLSNSRRG